MKKFLILLSLLYLICSLPHNVVAQSTNDESVHSTGFIDKSKWKKIAGKYDYSEKKIEKKNEEKNTEVKYEKPTEPTPLSPELNNFLIYSLFALVILILVFMGYRFLGVGKLFDNKKIDHFTVQSLDEIENNLKEADIDRHLHNAIASADYKLALRLYYLNLLKMLTIKEIINWKREKTNGAYLNELYGNPIYNDFLKCTEIFEFFWFNEKAVTDTEIFNKIRPVFEQTIQKASKINIQVKS